MIARTFFCGLDADVERQKRNDAGREKQHEEPARAKAKIRYPPGAQVSVRSVHLGTPLRLVPVATRLLQIVVQPR
jgi:hypothetical protein